MGYRDDYIPVVTPNNIIGLGFSKMMDGIRPYCLEEMPEGSGGNPEALHEIDRLIGRFANLYEYLMFLQATVSYEAASEKLLGNIEVATLLTRKKDALYELARGVRYKHEACSRMLTAWQIQQTDSALFDKVDYAGREHRADELPFPDIKKKKTGRKEMTGWDVVP